MITRPYLDNKGRSVTAARAIVDKLTARLGLSTKAVYERKLRDV